MGAACVSGQDAGKQSKFNLASGTCTNDVCCNGFNACYYSFLTGVNTLSCRGEQACRDLRAELTGNLYCNSGTTNGAACSNNRASFTFSGSTDHCVECYGKETCMGQSQFIFMGEEKVKMTCGNTADSSGTCEEARISLLQDTCIHLVCKTNTCVDLSVMNDTSGSRCFCEGRGRWVHMCNRAVFRKDGSQTPEKKPFQASSIQRCIRQEMGAQTLQPGRCICRA